VSAGPDELRAEHDALASRLESRRSVDLVRRGAYGGFLALLTTGLSVKLAYDRWFSVRVTRFRGPPVFFYAAAVAAALLLCFTAWNLFRAVRLMRQEDAEFARLRELRSQLGLDP
jgi:ABC-type nickel/cobalt efflux system permease component RcnA